MPDTRDSLQRGLEHHRAGQWREAETLYRQVLDADPDQADALHLLGMLAHQRGDDAEADRLIARALAVRPSSVPALANHGVVLRALGRDDEALARYEQALAIRPDHVDALFNRAVLLSDIGRVEEAVASYDGVLALAPRHVEALYNRGNALAALGRSEAAEASYRQALGARPGYADALCNLGGLLRRKGDLAGAGECYARALDAAPGHAPSWVGFSEFLNQIDTVEERWSPLVLAALRNPHVDPQTVQRVALGLVARAPLMGELLALVDDPAGLDERLSALREGGGLKSLLTMPLLHAVLEEAIVADFRFERLLTALRRMVLTEAREPIATDDLASFAASLALQCFANEYVYAETDGERASVDALIERVSGAVASGATCPALSIAAIAAYRPLHTLAVADRLPEAFAADMAADATFCALITRQVLEPQVEERIKDAIPRLTGSTDAVSQAVRRQYEESPYPRWRRRGHGEGKSIDAVLRGLFPGRTVAVGSPRRPDILVAGCGTGSHSIQVARRFSGARVLAVDLSLASLAYARRATEASGIDTIDYAQADILELGALDRRFDLIDSSGVLHHMRDPLAGWRVLRGLVKPGGVMKIALYSRRARRDLPALRRFIAERGFEATPAGIRAARQAIMAGEGRGLLGRFDGVDFYSTSACRDLLCHVQEHVFSPIDIKQALARLDLTFLGFEFRNPAHERAYRARFPDDPACDSLDDWDAFEAENPDTFIGMYQFWCAAARQ